MIGAAFFDAKPYDRRYFERAAGAEKINFRFHEFRLRSETTAAVEGAQAVCVFVAHRKSLFGDMVLAPPWSAFCAIRDYRCLR